MNWPDDYINKIICGDCLEVMKGIPDESIQCCITSPPYWGLRDYQTEGQFGLEETPEAYAAKMVEVFEEVRRVLKPDGTLWLNLGDSYAGSGRGRDADGTWNPGQGGSKQGTNVGSTLGRQVNSKSLHKNLIAGDNTGNAWVKPPNGFKRKDLIGIPWMVAFALRSAGWYLRCDIIWSKPNPMPESVTDRPTKAHEYLFLFSKSIKYYYDQDSIREPFAESSVERANQDIDNQAGSLRAAGGAKTNGPMKMVGDPSVGANKRSVWEIPTQPFKQAHFATFPVKLIEPCILAGSRAGDIILDPFGGAGTTAFRSKELGRKHISIELNPDYCKIAEQRLAQEELF